MGICTRAMDMRVILLYSITFLDLFAAGLVVPLIGIHAKSLGASHFIVGLMGSFYSGFQLFSGPLLGSVSDVKGRKPVLLMTLLFCSVTYLSVGFTSSIYILLCLRIILGIFKHTQTLAKAFVTDVSKNEDRSEIYGKMAAVSGIGITLGPLVGGHIQEDNPIHGFSIACSIAFILFVINIGLVYLISLSNDNFSYKKSKDFNLSNTMSDSWKKYFQEVRDIDWHLYWNIFLLKGLGGFSLSIFYTVYTPLLKSHYNLSPKWIGYTLSFQGIIGSLCSYFINYINYIAYKSDTDYTLRNYQSFVVLSLTFLGFILCNHWLLFSVLLIPLAISNTIIRLSTLEMIVQKSPENQRGSLIGASASVRSIAGIIGPFIAGFLSDLFSINYVLIVSVISSCAGTLIALNYRKLKQNVLHKKQN